MTSQTPLFQIKNLKCVYRTKPDRVVLDLPLLNIPKGELIVLLGVSGVGKSTILETLALMNNTFAPNSEVLFIPDSMSPPIAMPPLWEKRNSNQRADIRRDHFSFIFQGTNLMDNFSIKENASLASMIQGKSFGSCQPEVGQYLGKVNLSDMIENIEHHKLLSGGQQQRLAFVRAAAAQYSVLFGDEPTGNLDEDNARALMGIIREDVHSRNSTAIIVSHGIDLTLEFADRIYVLTRKESAPTEGTILPQHTFVQDRDTRTWMRSQGMQPLAPEALRAEIKTLFAHTQQNTNA